MFIDSYLPSFGTIIGSLVTFGIISVGLRISLSRPTYTAIYIGIAVIVAFLAVFSINMMRKTYDVSMLNWQLKRRSRGASLLDGLDFSDGKDTQSNGSDSEPSSSGNSNNKGSRRSVLDNLDFSGDGDK